MVLPAFVITGAPALIIILVILALLVLGAVSFFRLAARGAKRVVQHAERDGSAAGDTRSRGGVG
jgi:hypothetical protein